MCIGPAVSVTGPSSSANDVATELELEQLLHRLVFRAADPWRAPSSGPPHSAVDLSSASAIADACL